MNATDITGPVCPFSVAISDFVSIFQSLIASSEDPLVRIVPFVLNATDRTGLVCPSSVTISV